MIQVDPENWSFDPPKLPRMASPLASRILQFHETYLHSMWQWIRQNADCSTLPPAIAGIATHQNMFHDVPWCSMAMLDSVLNYQQSNLMSKYVKVLNFQSTSAGSIHGKSSPPAGYMAPAPWKSRRWGRSSQGSVGHRFAASWWARRGDRTSTCQTPTMPVISGKIHRKIHGKIHRP